VTLLREETPPISASTLEAAALIKEARRLRRRRWLVGIAGVLLVVLAGAVGYVVSHSKSTKPSVTTATSQPSRNGAPVAGAIVTPRQPGKLAVGPNDDLYVIDGGRDEILRHLPNGTWRVVAGDGRQGFAGDGGPAIRAELRVGRWSGIAIARNGTVYFSDSGNDRVREVLPDGIIETVAGGGRLPLPDRVGEKVPALRAALPDPLGVALGPRGNLAIAASLVVSLDRARDLTWIAGSKQFVPWCRTCDIGEGNLYDADQLAYDGAGDLLVSSDDFPVGFGVAEVRVGGTIRDIGGVRGEGGEPPAISPGTHGSVVVAGMSGLYTIANGSREFRLVPHTFSATPGSSVLSKALGGWPPKPPRHYGQSFFGGDGIAESPSGVIYADASPFPFLAFYCIVELTPSGSAKALFES
jgi:hypothetical protein